jgi:hypothetical protein
MRKFCQIEYCDNPGAKVVPVSVAQPSDQRRTLCVTCEEAYAIGVQHGTAVARARPVLPHLGKFLGKGGFVVVTYNKGDPSVHGPVEAWAYTGPLDLAAATPVTFGIGKGVQDALEALEGLLDQRGRCAQARAANPKGRRAGSRHPPAGS